MIPSDEQQTIIDHIKAGKNVVCSAIAGAGKSSTVLFLAEQMPTSKMLQITYNSQLRLEVKGRVQEAGLTNLSVHTFHSLAVKYYNSAAHTDTELRKIVATRSPPLREPQPIGVLILDEMQDSTKLYYQFIQKYLTDMVISHPTVKIQILVLGDVMQGLYEFKGSDTRFLTLARELWIGCPHLLSTDFVPCSLKMSYRITRPMADFVNNVLLGMPNHLLACKDGVPVNYIRESRHMSHKLVVISITRLLGLGAKPDDFFILGASMKNSIKMLENELVERGVPCHVPMFEKEKMDDRVIRGKVVFSTFHSVKGRQRKHVYVMGFDQSYFEYYAKELNRQMCPNTLYVACTRGQESLTVIERDSGNYNRPLSFLKKTHLQLRQTVGVNFHGNAQILITVQDNKKKPANLHFISPTELIKFISDSTLDLITPIVDRLFTRISKEEDEVEISLPVVTETSLNLWEDVSDINGIAIPCIYSERVLGKTSEDGHVLYRLINEIVKQFKPNEYVYLKRACQQAPKDAHSVSDVLYLANLYSAVQAKLYFKVKQIPRAEYTWLSEDIIGQCMDRLERVLQPDGSQGQCEVERMIINPMMDTEIKMIDDWLQPYFDEERFRFTGVVDLVDLTTVWELKCTSSTTLEHFLQLAIYAWIWKVCRYGDRQFKLFNIKTGEIFVMADDCMADLTTIVVNLLKSRFIKTVRKTDEEFLADATDGLEYYEPSSSPTLSDVSLDS
jgi:hypothetical protein